MFAFLFDILKSTPASTNSMENSPSASTSPPTLPSSSSPPFELLDSRPNPDHRKFRNETVDKTISTICDKLKDKQLAKLFENCYPNTLDTTIELHSSNNGKPNTSVDTFVITGDIPAMWLRDSTNQLLPYIRFGKEDNAMKLLVLGVVNRQAFQVERDPYSNAFKQNTFNKDVANPWSVRDQVKPSPSMIVWESKYELDSVAAFLKISYWYWKINGKDFSFYDGGKCKWIEAVQRVIKLVQEQQKGTLEDPDPEYRFERDTNNQTETLMMGGRTAPAKRCGLVKSAFRPSDDACTLPFLIPSNAMMCVELSHIAEMLKEMKVELELAATAQALSDEIRSAIMKHSIVNHPEFGKIYAFEVDGYGSAYCMDDANVPSLLSLPYLNFTTVDDKVYQNTRNFVLSSSNPYFFEGSAGKGIGGPHCGLDMVWPMSIIMRALTSVDDKEIMECLEMLKTTTAGKDFMHESFHKNDANRFTRSWFAWANALFGELILTLTEERPHLIF